jgi:hypothetical protein
MPVGHRPSIAYDAWKRCGVDQLLWASVIRMAFDVGSIRNQASIRLHGAMSMDAHGPIAFVDEMSAPLRFHDRGS